MTAKQNDSHIPTGREPPASPESGARPPGGRSRRVLVGAAVGVAALITLGSLAAVGAFNGNASDADQLRGHAQPVRVPGRDQHRRARRDHPEVGPEPRSPAGRAGPTAPRTTR